MSGAVAAATPGASATGAAPFRLFSQADLDFETLVVLGGAAYGVSEIGEVVTAVNAVNASGATYQAYYDQCLYFVLATTARAREADAYAAVQACWDQAARLFDPPFERVGIPYEGSWLPGYLLKPDARDTRRPTVILNGGSDTTSIDMYVFGGAAVLERGYNALIFDGPGQGSMLFQRQVPYRADWEKVITPVVDYLRSRPEIDPDRIALLGLSMCGEAAVRAAAFEHRLAAVVPDPGVVNAWLAWPASIRDLFADGATKAGVNRIWQQDIIPHLDPANWFTIAKRAELFDIAFMLASRAGQTSPDLWDLGQAIMKVDCGSVAGHVTSPTLVTQYQDDTFYPGQGRAGGLRGDHEVQQRRVLGGEVEVSAAGRPEQSRACCWFPGEGVHRGFDGRGEAIEAAFGQRVKQRAAVDEVTARRTMADAPAFPVSPTGSSCRGSPSPPWSAAMSRGRSSRSARA